MGNCHQSICLNDKENSTLNTNFQKGASKTFEEMSYPDMKLEVGDFNHSKRDLDFWKLEVQKLAKIRLTEEGAFFQGEMLKNKRNGYGIMSMPCKSTYQGKLP